MRPEAKVGVFVVLVLVTLVVYLLAKEIVARRAQAPAPVVAP